MNKTLIVILGSILILFLTGCSIDDTTSLGRDVIGDIDSSLLDISKNFRPFDLDTSFVQGAGRSVPDLNDTVFGIHSSKVLPIGGRNGEVATGYFEFRSLIDVWKKFPRSDTSIFSVSIVFDTANSSKADYNFSQKIGMIRVTDSTYRYKRNRTDVEQLKADTGPANYGLINTTKFVYEITDPAFFSEIFYACTAGRGSYDTSKGDKSEKEKFFHPEIFSFVVASETNDDNFAYVRSSPYISIKTKNSNETKDTIYSDTTVIDTVHKVYTTPPLLVTRDDFKLQKVLSNSPSVVHDTVTSDTVIFSSILLDSIRTSSVSKDTLKIIDSVRVANDSTFLHTKTITTKNRVNDSTLEITYTSDSLNIHKVQKTLNVFITKLSSNVYTLPASYSNYAVYELSDTLEDRKMLPYTSFGPQRTAVFELSLDSLWKKLNEAPDASGKRFSEILSAGVTLTGTTNIAALAALSDVSAKNDTIIAVRWLISDVPYHSGIKLTKRYRAWSSKDNLKSGQSATLPIEKYLQELMSGYGSSSAQIKGPSKVYLYLEQLNSGSYWKQILWSKPTLTTVLTNLK